ncbi:hypothetical protein EJB05_35481, partial [Eragrostis curvula]
MPVEQLQAAGADELLHQPCRHVAGEPVVVEVQLADAGEERRHLAPEPVVAEVHHGDGHVAGRLHGPREVVALQLQHGERQREHGRRDRAVELLRRQGGGDAAGEGVVLEVEAEQRGRVRERGGDAA